MQFSDPEKSLLKAGSELRYSNTESERVIKSPNGQYVLEIESNGNLILKIQNSGTVIWATGTFGGSGSVLKMQRDMHLVLYNGSGGAIWATQVYIGQHSIQWKANGYLKVQDDGNLAVYDGDNNIMWESETTGGTQKSTNGGGKTHSLG